MSSKGIRIDHEKIRNRAREERWTPSKLSEKTGISRAAIAYILSGLRDPQATNLKKLCDAIELPIEEAFTETAAA